MQTDTQSFTHDIRDLRKEELDLRMIHHVRMQLDLRTQYAWYIQIFI
jgi:hypothetical protein